MIRHVIAKRLFCLLFVAVVLVTSDALVYAQSSTGSHNGAGQRLEGTFLVTGITDAGVPVIPIPFPRLFTSDGGVVAPAVNPLVSTGVGEWIRTGNREFAIEFVALRYASPTGPVAGSSKTKVALQLNENGDELHGRFKTENFDLSGNLISTVTGTVDGKRIQIEPL